MAVVVDDPLAQPELFPVEHVSYQEARLKHGLPERVYADRWSKLAAEQLSGGSFLEMILCPSGRDPMLMGCPPVSARDARVAASVIQWLGTNCGMSFLRDTERVIEQAQDRQRALDSAKHQVEMHDWNEELRKRNMFPLVVYVVRKRKTRDISLEDE